jgi:hypothetical protein
MTLDNRQKKSAMLTSQNIRAPEASNRGQLKQQPVGGCQKGVSATRFVQRYIPVPQMA